MPEDFKRNCGYGLEIQGGLIILISCTFSSFQTSAQKDFFFFHLSKTLNCMIS